MRRELLSWIRLIAFAGGIVALIGGLFALTPAAELIAMR
jgi:hypothetical protein